MAAKSDGIVSVLAESPAPSPAARRYSLPDCCWTLAALLVFFSDGASDLWLAADYYLRRDYWWFALTLVFIVVPSVVVQGLSFRWFAYDYAEEEAGGGGAAAAAAVVAAAGADNHLPGGKGGEQRGAGARSSGGGGRTCCRACVWLFQSLMHILQLAQVWR